MKVFKGESEKYVGFFVFLNHNRFVMKILFLTNIPDQYYEKVEERQRKYHLRESNHSTWEEAKERLKNKYFP